MPDEREPTAREIAAFRRAAYALAELGEAGLSIYLANSTLNLMSGPSHESDTQGRARQDRVRAHVHIPRSGGGDW